MRSLGVALSICIGCGQGDPFATRTYSFGPYTLQPSEEVTDQCVQITLGNDEPLYVNRVELTTGVGFHHSNWLYVPENVFPGDDGTYKCSDRNFDQAIAVLRGGGVLFAQSTQSPHDVQQFAPGVALKIPAHFKLVSTIHLLDPSDASLHLTPTIALTPIDPKLVTTHLAGMSFENHALGLPPRMQSAFTVDCDLTQKWNMLYQQGAVTSPYPDFNIYYALAHYHAMGTGLTLEAVKTDSTATTVFSTVNHVGDTLGGPLDPPFSMAGYARLRFTCAYFNNSDTTIVWGTGQNEMCVYLAFTDSAFHWGGGIPLDGPPGTGMMVNNVMTFYSNSCSVVYSLNDL